MSVFCRNCGNELADTAKFCNKCGTPVAKTAPPPEAKPQVKPEIIPEKKEQSSPIPPVAEQQVKPQSAPTVEQVTPAVQKAAQTAQAAAQTAQAASAAKNVAASVQQKPAPTGPIPTQAELNAKPGRNPSKLVPIILIILILLILAFDGVMLFTDWIFPKNEAQNAACYVLQQAFCRLG